MIKLHPLCRLKVALITTVIFVVTILFSGCISTQDTSSLDQKYENVKGKNDKIYYTSKISKKEAETLVKYLDETEFVNNDTIMRLDKDSSNKYVLDIYAPKYLIKSNGLDKYYISTAEDISSDLFKDSIVVINLCQDSDFKPVKTFTSHDRDSD